MKLNNKTVTTKNIYGKWVNEGDDKKTILITQSEVNLVIDGNCSITLKSNCEWVGEYLIFSDVKRKYFIKNATSKALIFGAFKVSASINLEVEWEFLFNRLHN